MKILNQIKGLKLKQQTNKQLRKKQKKIKKKMLKKTAKKNHLLILDKSYQSNGLVLGSSFNSEQYLENMTYGGLLLSSAISLLKEKK
jgi:hypothetical protein